MRALLAALETLPLAEQHIELLPPLRIQGRCSVPMLIEPLTAL